MSRVDPQVLSPIGCGGPRLALACVALALLAVLIRPPSASAAGSCRVPAAAMPFMERVFARLDAVSPDPYGFLSWSQPGRSTQETLGLHRFDAVDPERLLAQVFDVDGRGLSHAHVLASRSVPDPRFQMPGSLRYYQLLDLSFLGTLHFEAVLTDAGTCHGFRVAAWSMLGPETDALSREIGIRNAYNDGAWLASATTVGYAISSAPRSTDMNVLQQTALTSGSDLMAKSMIEANIRSMYLGSRER